MSASIPNVGIRSRLLAGFALICLLLGATVGYTVHAMSDISWRVKRREGGHRNQPVNAAKAA